MSEPLPFLYGGARIALVGGRGFVGDKLSSYLEYLECIHCVMDITRRKDNSPACQYRTDYRVDLCCEADICSVFAEFCPTVVIHLAAYGMSGSAMLDPLCHLINYQGTQNLLSACYRYNVRGVIYTSTYNVVFGGQEVLGGSETMPYFSRTHTDQYAPTKTLAEKLVLNYNRRQTENGSMLITCALRPAAIYGPGESRHFPRIIAVMDSGLYIARVGDAIVDWVHVDNMVQAFCKALEQILIHLESPKACPVAGQAYFISDGTPIRQNLFLEPLRMARGVATPMVTIPASVAFAGAFIMEQIHYLGRYTGLFSYAPFLTQAEVAKVAVSHYFSIEKAVADMNYCPSITTELGAKEMGDSYRLCVDNRNYFRTVDPVVATLILVGMFLLSFYALEPADTQYDWYLFQQLKTSIYFLFRSQLNLQCLLAAAHITHLYEASVAYRICRSDLKCSVWNTYAWCIQTSIFGYGSLWLLYARMNFMKMLKTV